MNSKTILIVDDTAANLDILSEFLIDYDVVFAISGQDALSIVSNEKIDLILLDIMMPQMDGYEVCHKLKENQKTKNIPIIFITAKTDEDSIEKAFDIGGADYITKPFKPKELLSRIKTQLHLKHLQNIEMEHNKQVAFLQLMHNIAHQWRQPLSVISTCASGMRMREELNMLKREMILEYCDIIVNNCTNLSRTIDNFTSFVNSTDDKAIFNLKTFIEDNYTLLFKNLKNTNIIIEIENDINLNTYPSKFLQILLIIIANAAEFRKNDKDAQDIIFLRATKKENDIIINVQDNGIGIKDEIIDKIFEPYFTTKHQSQGKGMGLYMAYNILTYLLDGDVEVSNEIFEYKNIKQTGTNFQISLPK